jgi:hypothetical protein
MRILTSLILACLFCITIVVAQNNQKPIFLTTKSNITTAEIAEGFSKYCPNVALTQNQDKADYLLEAAETMGADDGSTHRHWHLTLMNPEGDVLVTTHPEMHFGHKYKHHFESICKFINK